MISKTDILERATEWGLTPDVVEKDYVLGWVLACIPQHPVLSQKWIFKGGTCLKKCVLETYRFSEDLDFTLLETAPYTESEIRSDLVALAQIVERESGISIAAQDVTVRERKNRAGEMTFQAGMGYRGPMAIPGPPKIRLDLTRHEPLLLGSVQRVVFHPYPDALPTGTRVACYHLQELIAEKTRALVERTRPRDLYDAVLLADAANEDSVRIELRDIATRKFAAKGLPLPSSAELVRLAHESPELRSEWQNMLGHQLPALPDVDDFLARLPHAVRWLDTVSVTSAPQLPLAPVPLRTGEMRATPPAMRMWSQPVALEAVNYAGAAHLLVEIEYHGHRRVIEPYSLRRPKTGNLLLYGFERTKDGYPTNDIRAYKVGEIGSAGVLSTAFTPRYAIELVERSGVWKW